MKSRCLPSGKPGRTGIRGECCSLRTSSNPAPSWCSKGRRRLRRPDGSPGGIHGGSGHRTVAAARTVADHHAGNPRQGHRNLQSICRTVVDARCCGTCRPIRRRRGHSRAGAGRRGRKRRLPRSWFFTVRAITPAARDREQTESAQIDAMFGAERLRRLLVDVVMGGGGLPQLTEVIAREMKGAALITTSDGREICRAGGRRGAQASVCLSRRRFHRSSADRHRRGRIGSARVRRSIHRGVRDFPPITSTHGRLALFTGERVMTSYDQYLVERAASCVCVGHHPRTSRGVGGRTPSRQLRSRPAPRPGRGPRSRCLPCQDIRLGLRPPAGDRPRSSRTRSTNRPLRRPLGCPSSIARRWRSPARSPTAIPVRR